MPVLMQGAAAVSSCSESADSAYAVRTQGDTANLAARGAQTRVARVSAGVGFRARWRRICMRNTLAHAASVRAHTGTSLIRAAGAGRATWGEGLFERGERGT
jgi:hypothetical protein